MRAVVALGGNALSPPRSTGSADEMRGALARSCGYLADLVTNGVGLLLTHGNGPQVGRILLQQEAAAPEIPAMPMDVCGAQSQGQIGYLLAQALDNALRERGSDVRALCLVTQVVVDGYDPAFRRPTKPVGPSYDRPAAQRIAHETGHVFTIQPDKRWRRVVASPEPLRFVEERQLLQIVESGNVVVAAGGGGVPVVDVEGEMRGVDAVVDKDRSAAKLALLVKADLLLILTEVEAVQRDFGTPNATPLRHLTAQEARAMESELPEGSMGPKVAAACDFVENGGPRAVITSLDKAAAAVAGDAGTEITA